MTLQPRARNPARDPVRTAANPAANTSARTAARMAALAAALACAVSLQACVPMLFGGAIVGGSMIVTDRRTSGTQVEDQAIELKSLNRVTQAVGDRGHVSVTSYDRLVLITGEVPTDADKASVEQQVSRIENVRSVVNELAVAGTSSLTSRSNDALITSKVKASLIDAQDLQANAFKIVTERGNVYLMGRVTEAEATRAADMARTVSGVQKVVRVFEVITPEELARLSPKPASK